MRIYQNPTEAVRETERDVAEMGIRVHPHSMQDKDVRDDDQFSTLELQGYGFKIHGWSWDDQEARRCLSYLLGEQEGLQAFEYIEQEHHDRTQGVAMNPGKAWRRRRELWDQFRLANGTFHYTYSERFAPQLVTILNELRTNPDTRQAIITIHSNIQPVIVPNPAGINIHPPSVDLLHLGGAGRVPCSMYYQLMVRMNAVDLIYSMRSCDLLTHFPVDILLAMRFRDFVAKQLGLVPGEFTYFAGSLHAYKKDMARREAF